MLTALSLHCGSPRDYTPLIGTETGLVQLTWGEGIPTAKEKMTLMEGVEFRTDTLVILEEDPLYISADSMIPPRVGNLSYVQCRFVGGTFFGFPVDEWLLWFSDGNQLRNVDIVFSPDLAGEEIYGSVGSRLLTLYGIPERGGIVWEKYRSRNWTERHAMGEQPETGALLTWGRIPGHVTLSYHDLMYADSLDAIEFGEPIALGEWNKRKGLR
jgi:hypothetical protein